MTFTVKIDGVITALTYDSFSGARGHQYLTPGAQSSHAFPSHLEVGQTFRTGGHHYEVICTGDRVCPECNGRGGWFSLDGMAFHPSANNEHPCERCGHTGAIP